MIAYRSKLNFGAAKARSFYYSSKTYSLRTPGAITISLAAHAVIIMGLGFAFAASIPNRDAPSIEIVFTQSEEPSTLATDLISNLAETDMERVEESAETEIDRYREEIASIKSGLQSITREMFITSAQTPDELDEWMRKWRQKVELVAIQRAEQYGLAKLRGDVLLIVSINASGKVNSARILSSSGDSNLDEVARNIAITSGPFDPLPEEVRSRTDILHITRTWRFGPSGANISR